MKLELSTDGAAFVAGGSGGSGQAICLALAQAGADVFLTYRNNLAAAEDVAGKIRKLGRRAEIAQVALEDATAVSHVVNQAVEKFGRLHSVVYAVGPAVHMHLISETTIEEWTSTVNTDINGCFNLVHATLPIVKKAGGGAYVAITTAALERIPPRDITSVAPKAAVEVLFRALAKEEGRNGIRANCVPSGWIDSGLGRVVLGNEFTPEQVEAMRRALPLRRMGKPEEIAAAVLFLLSPAAAYITGQSLAVDGGAQL